MILALQMMHSVQLRCHWCLISKQIGSANNQVQEICKVEPCLMVTSLMQPLFCPGQLPIHFLVTKFHWRSHPIKTSNLYLHSGHRGHFFGRAIISVKTSLNLDRTREFDPSPLIWPVSWSIGNWIHRVSLDNYFFLSGLRWMIDIPRLLAIWFFFSEF